MNPKDEKKYCFSDAKATQSSTLNGYLSILNHTINRSPPFHAHNYVCSTMWPYLPGLTSHPPNTLFLLPPLVLLLVDQIAVTHPPDVTEVRNPTRHLRHHGVKYNHPCIPNTQIGWSLTLSEAASAVCGNGAIYFSPPEHL